MKHVHLDAVIGFALIIISGFFYIISSNMPPEPALFPKLILAGLSLLSISIFTSGVIKTIHSVRSNIESEKFFNGLRGPVTTYLAAVIYAVLIPFLGFFMATSIASIFFMYYFGYRSYVKAAAVIITLNSFIYILFVWQLKISLPEGIFI